MKVVGETNQPCYTDSYVHKEYIILYYVLNKKNV